PDSRAGRGTEKTRRSDALIREKFEFLFRAQRAGAGCNVGKENRAPFQNFDGCLDTILALLRAFLFCDGRIGKVLRLRLLLRRRARDLNMMAPRAAPGSLARAALWPLRISFRRTRIVPVVIPVGAPFMDVVAHVVQPVSVRLVKPHRLRPELPSLVVIENRLR